MIKLAQPLLVLLAIQNFSLALEAEEDASCEQSGVGCASERQMLQLKSIKTQKTVHDADLGEGNFLADGTFLGLIAGATMVIHADSPAARGEVQEWIIIQDQKCSDSDIAHFEEALSTKVVEEWHGHAKTGLCALLVNATKSALQEAIKAAGGVWSSKHTVVETDSKGVVADLPASETSATADMHSGRYTPWHLDRIDDRKGLDHSYTINNDGGMITVYVLDTGIRESHKDFEGRAVRFADTITRKGIWHCARDASGDCADDLHGHGTHVAGIVAGKTYGVAKKARIKGIKVLNNKARGNTKCVIQGMDAAMSDKSRPSVVTMSLGFKGTSKAHEAAIARLNDAGITVTVSAGNNNFDACRKSPAAVPAAITVGATDKNNKRASFSNYGTCVDIFAPGKKIASAYPKNKFGESDTHSVLWSGTSQATPMVAGAAALLLSVNPKLSPREVRDALMQLATRDVVTDLKGSPNLLLFVEDRMGQATITFGSNPNGHGNYCVDEKRGLVCNEKSAGGGFTVYRDANSNKICADSHHGQVVGKEWKIVCSQGSFETVSIGSTSGGGKCILRKGLTCDKDAGDKLKRMKATHFPDTFDIQTDATQVCATRTDGGPGWTLDLTITCARDAQKIRPSLSTGCGGAVQTHRDGSVCALCMDVWNAKLISAQELGLWWCKPTGMLNQLFRYDKNTFEIQVLANPNLCVSVFEGKKQEGTPLRTWQCKGSQNDQWLSDSKRIKLKSHPHLCLGIGGTVQKGAKLQLTSCTAASQAEFLLM